MGNPFLVIFVVCMAATAAGQTVDVLDFRSGSIQSILNSSYSTPTQAPQLNLLAKFGTKTQEKRSSF
jgi:hypothetical protein